MRLCIVVNTCDCLFNEECDICMEVIVKAEGEADTP